MPEKDGHMIDGDSFDTTEVLHCSFCGKSNKDVAFLIAAPDVFICDECVDLCADIIAEKREESHP